MIFRTLFVFLMLKISIFLACEESFSLDQTQWENEFSSSLQNILDEAENDFLTKSLQQSVEKFSSVLEVYSNANADSLFCRALFGRALAFAMQGEEENAYLT